MNRAVFIRALIGVVGVFAIVLSVVHLESVMFMLRFGTWAPVAVWELCLSVLVALVVPVALLVLGLVLIFMPPRRLTELPPEQAQTQGFALTPVAICRIVSVFCGILVLAWALPKLSATALTWIMFKEYRTGYLSQNWPVVLGNALQVVLGVYLFLGAPHIVRWQVRGIQPDGGSPRIERSGHAWK